MQGKSLAIGGFVSGLLNVPHAFMIIIKEGALFCSRIRQ
jgi:hypothetical protein